MKGDPDRLFQILVEANPWWDRGTLPADFAPAYHRRDFYPLERDLRDERISLVSGPRQVGKTTVVRQLIAALLVQRVPPRNILFFSFDSPGLGPISEDLLTDVLRLYEERVLGEAFRDQRTQVFAFLDEVTRDDHWHRSLKGWYDLRLPIKFVATSSSHSALRAGTAESLVGRADLHVLLSWKFSDVLLFLDDPQNEAQRTVDGTGAVASAVQEGSPRPLHRHLMARREHSRTRTLRLAGAVDRYLLEDGLPRLLTSGPDSREAAKTVADYLTLTLANDLYRHYGIRGSTRVLEDLLALVAHQSGQVVSYRSLADSLGVELRTVIEYLDHLESAFLISRAEFYAKSRAARVRKQRKIYVPNPAILNVLKGRMSPNLLREPSYLGPLVESVVHDHAKRMAQSLGHGVGSPAFYWRDPAGKEVDVVVEIDGVPLPIEVKYRHDPDRDLRGIQSFMDKFGVQLGLVVTRDRLAVQEGLLFIPLADFLQLA